MHPRYRRLFTLVLAAVDTAIIAVSMSLAWWLRLGSGLVPAGSNFPLAVYLGVLFWLLPLFWLAYSLNGLYRLSLRPPLSVEAWEMVRSNAIMFLLLTGFLFFFRQTDISRTVLAIFASLNTMGGCIARRTARSVLIGWLDRGQARRQVLMLGGGPLGRQFLQRVRDGRLPGHQVVAFLDDNPNLREVDGVPALGAIEHLQSLLAELVVDEVVIALPLHAYEKISRIVATCEVHGVHVRIIPDYLQYVPARAAAEDVDGLPLIELRHLPLNDPAHRLIKRLLDVTVTALALVVGSPLLLLIGALVKLTSPGPVLFRQRRLGLNRRPFEMLKFRTMYLGDGEDTAWTTRDDPRRSPLGVFLRRTSLDELPQLFNVLRGEMSLVGPRPERPYFAERFRTEIEKYMLKHLVRPGITGWAQVSGWRGDTSIEERTRYDLYYIENWTLWLDLKIIWLTLWRGMLGKNAY